MAAPTLPTVGSILQYFRPHEFGSRPLAALCVDSPAGVDTPDYRLTLQIFKPDGTIEMVSLPAVHATTWDDLSDSEKAMTAYWQWPDTTAQGGSNS